MQTFHESIAELGRRGVKKAPPSAWGDVVLSAAVFFSVLIGAIFMVTVISATRDEQRSGMLQAPAEGADLLVPRGDLVPQSGLAAQHVAQNDVGDALGDHALVVALPRLSVLKPEVLDGQPDAELAVVGGRVIATGRALRDGGFAGVDTRLVIVRLRLLITAGKVEHEDSDSCFPPHGTEA